MRVPVCPLLLSAFFIFSLPASAVEVSTDYWHWWTAGLWNLNGISGHADHVIHYEGQTYFAGAFERAGLEDISAIAGWDGTGWSATTLAPPYAIYAGDLIAFRYRYDGTTTVEMVPNWVFRPTTLYGDDTRLAAAGYSMATGELVVSVWNEALQQYEDIPGAFTNSQTIAEPEVLALLPWQGGWIAAGREFYAVGGVPVNHVAYWDGAQWHDWSRPSDSYALAEFQGSVFVGDRQGVFRRDGSTWTPIASITSAGIFPSIRSLFVDGNFLYVGGQFDTIGPLSTQNIARYTGAAWQVMSTGIKGQRVLAITSDGSRIYAAGVFSGATGENARNAAYWDGTRWNRMGPAGLELLSSGGDAVAARTWALHDDKIYAGGDFAAWGVQELNGVGRLVNGRWTPLSSGFDGAVNDLVSYAGFLVAAGEFTHAGSTSLPGIARRVGSSWLPLTTSMNGTVQDAIVLDGDLYIGGTFYEIDGQVMTHVARYDGSAWSRVGGQVYPSVMALGSFQGDLVIGGTFIVVEGQGVLYVARWDGTQWNPMGAGLPNPVLALSEIDGVLYAGGDFGVRAWNGAAWMNLDGGVNGPVRDIASWNGRVFMVGDFTQVDAQAQEGIACWDPLAQSWADPGFSLRKGSQPLGTSGALLPVGNKLYVSGTFDYVDRPNTPTVFVANVAEITDPTIVSAPAAPLASRAWMKIAPNPFNPRTVIDYGIESACPVSIRVFDLRGRRIATLIDESLDTGSYQVTWDGRDEAGRAVASGVYLVRITAGATTSTQKAVLTK